MRNNIHVRKKREENPPINQYIRAKEVRLVDIEKYGESDGKFSIEEARMLASKQNLDLVEISNKANPIICKILDYKKHKYDQKKAKQERDKNQKKVVIKEMRLSPDIGKNDYDVKLKKVTEFISKGNKTKVYIQFKGGRGFSEMVRNRGLETLLKFIVDLEEIATPDSSKPSMTGRRMSLMLSPKKKK